MKKISWVLILILQSLMVFSQSVKASFEQWDLSGAETSNVFIDGQEALKMKGRIFLNDVEFLNGTIDVDILFSELRFFPGIDFRVQDPRNAERFYVRPHQSGNPDANQYTPVLNGTAGWQLYHGDRFAKAIEYEFDTWHHIRLEVFNDELKVYFDHMSEPIIHTHLKGGFDAGGFSLGATRNYVHFANFQYEMATPDSFEGKLEVPEIPKEVISEWEVSNLIHDSLYIDYQIDMKAGNLKWQKASVEPEGLVNFSRFHARSRGVNSVIARLKINSDRKQVKEILFGASDGVNIYLNGKLLYKGNDTFRSRDYRFLGTIGFFDAVYPELRKGDNEIWFVVREGFGGWGLQAQIPDRQGITVN